MVKNQNIDRLNIILIPACLILAYILPFRLLIYSYAILGPLHYLTEINWLNDNNYFSKSKKTTVWILGGLTAFLSIPHLFFLPGIEEWTRAHKDVYDQVIALTKWGDPVIFTSLILGITVVFTDNKMFYFLVGVLAMFVGAFLREADNFHILIGTFLPTLVHVYIFTGMFMLYGAIKSKNKTGYIPIILHVLVPIIVLYVPLDPEGYSIPESIKGIFKSSHQQTNLDFESLIGIEKVTPLTACKTQVFISYAYLYHYLNWFSKTSVIGWGKSLTKPRLLVVIAVSVLAIGTYFYNYSIGLKVLFFISMLHVLLEFPLNVVSIKETLKAVFKR
tara:strand:+ start:350 stop:1345 length:996 start_codon:yes stop_codon:yes gene_type:complete